MKIYAITKKGEHSENEDRILINDTILSDGIFETECNGELKICIVDGVGGNNASLSLRHRVLVMFVKILKILL